MLTIDTLHEFGVNTEEGLDRCLKNESFYLRLVNMALDDPGFDKLAAAVRNNDKKAAFEAAHALKGSLGNLALTPLAVPVAEITELLRGGQDADYTSLLEQILQKREQLIALRNN